MKEKKVSIVKGDIKYATSFNQCINAVIAEQKYLAATESFSLESSINFFKETCEMNQALTLALDGEKVVGWCNATPHKYSLMHVANLGIGILSDYRHQGIGKLLLEATIAHAKDFNQIEKIELDVFERNVEAFDFYKNNGFEFEGKRINSRKLNGVYDNLILMGKMV